MPDPKTLKTAKQNCINLFVCLSSDEQIKFLKGNKRPINNINDRLHMLMHMDFIDYIILYNEINDERKTLEQIKDEKEEYEEKEEDIMNVEEREIDQTIKSKEDFERELNEEKKEMIIQLIQYGFAVEVVKYKLMKQAT